MIESIRAYLSIQLIAWGLKLCPFPELNSYLRQGFAQGMDSYFNGKDYED